MSRKLFRTVGVVALIAGMGKMLRLGAGKTADGARRRRFHMHSHRAHSHKHPWFAKCKKRSKGEADKAGQDAETGVAEVVV
jgi:hypothetical protein